MSIAGATRPIVLIDDDPLVGELLRGLLARANIPNLVVAFQTIADLKRFLSDASANSARHPSRIPCLLFVDLNMPGSAGMDVIRWTRDQPDFQKMKVVVLSGSNLEADRELATVAGADHYHVKYPSPENLASLVKWATIGGTGDPVWTYTTET